MENTYDGIVEKWKVDLILMRARIKGLRPEEIDDALQLVVVSILDFKFDASKTNGGTEMSAFRTLIDRQLAQYQRRDAREKNRVQRVRAMRGVTEKDYEPLAIQPDHGERISLQFDVRAVRECLSETENSVCDALYAGFSHLDCANMLGITRHEVERHLRRIRECFEAAGLAPEAR